MESDSIWKTIHRRLDTVSAALSKGAEPSAEENARILRQRAEELAREPVEQKAGEYIEIVEFLLLKETYGIESQYVSEVHPLKDYTPVPCTPSFVLGLINVRSRIISVIDIRKFFEMPAIGISDLNKVIIIRDDKMEFGILADAVINVRNIAVESIEPPLPTLTGIRESFLRGITRDRTIVLDAARLLADKDLIVDEEA